MEKTEFKAAVEISREWDGGKVAEEIVKKLKKKTPNPKFILLFTTIHYEKEFKKILSGIKNSFPNSPLVGGTVAGFITPEGCFTRGVTALAVEYPNMEVAIGIGHNTKRDPRKAVEEASKAIKRWIKKNKWKNKLIITIISGGIVPRFPGIGQANLIQSERLGNLATKMLEMGLLKNTGVGREDEINFYLSKIFKDFYRISLSSIDDNKLLKNFQFNNTNILTNSMIIVAILTDKKISGTSLIPAKKIGIKFIITDISNDKKIIKKLDNQPATEVLLSSLKTKIDNILPLDKFYRYSFYFPLGYEKNNTYIPVVIGGFLGKHIAVGHKINKKDIYILSLSCDLLKREINKVNPGDVDISIGVSCSVILETIGDNIFEIKKVIDKKIKKYLIVFSGGEGYYDKRVDRYMNESLNFIFIK